MKQRGSEHKVWHLARSDRYVEQSICGQQHAAGARFDSIFAHPAGIKICASCLLATTQKYERE